MGSLPVHGVSIHHEVFTTWWMGQLLRSIAGRCVAGAWIRAVIAAIHAVHHTAFTRAMALHTVGIVCRIDATAQAIGAELRDTNCAARGEPLTNWRATVARPRIAVVR
jgi:hypothetical protein